MATAMTYTRCSHCQGTLHVPPDADDVLYTKDCPCVGSKTPGWDQTGITLGQIERAVQAEARLKEVLAVPENVREAARRTVAGYQRAQELLPLAGGVARPIERRCEGGDWPTYAELEAQRDKLQAFKDWTHAFLDAHGVPHHPPGTHGAAGCRIGDRMDWLLERLRQAEGGREVADLEAQNIGSQVAADLLRGIAEHGRSGGVFGGERMEAAAQAIAGLRAQVAALQQQVVGHCDRIARQSDLLTQAARKGALSVETRREILDAVKQYGSEIMMHFTQGAPGHDDKAAAAIGRIRALLALPPEDTTPEKPDA